MGTYLVGMGLLGVLNDGGDSLRERLGEKVNLISEEGYVISVGNLSENTLGALLCSKTVCLLQLQVRANSKLYLLHFIGALFREAERNVLIGNSQRRVSHRLRIDFQVVSRFDLRTLGPSPS